MRIYIISTIISAVFFIGYSLSLTNDRNIIQHINSEGTTPLRSTKPRNQAKNEINILFIGNSYTFFNDMPGMVLRIAQANPKNTTKLNIQSITFGGALLSQHLNNKNTITRIKNYK